MRIWPILLQRVYHRNIPLITMNKINQQLHAKYPTSKQKIPCKIYIYPRHPKRRIGIYSNSPIGELPATIECFIQHRCALICFPRFPEENPHITNNDVQALRYVLVLLSLTVGLLGLVFWQLYDLKHLLSEDQLQKSINDDIQSLPRPSVTRACPHCSTPPVQSSSYFEPSSVDTSEESCSGYSTNCPHAFHYNTANHSTLLDCCCSPDNQSFNTHDDAGFADHNHLFAPTRLSDCPHFTPGSFKVCLLCWLNSSHVGWLVGPALSKSTAKPNGDHQPTNGLVNNVKKSFGSLVACSHQHQPTGLDSALDAASALSRLNRRSTWPKLSRDFVAEMISHHLTESSCRDISQPSVDQRVKRRSCRQCHLSNCSTDSTHQATDLSSQSHQQGPTDSPSTILSDSSELSPTHLPTSQQPTPCYSSPSTPTNPSSSSYWPGYQLQLTTDRLVTSAYSWLADKLPLSPTSTSSRSSSSNSLEVVGLEYDDFLSSSPLDYCEIDHLVTSPSSQPGDDELDDTSADDNQEDAFVDQLLDTLSSMLDPNFMPQPTPSLDDPYSPPPPTSTKLQQADGYSTMAREACDITCDLESLERAVDCLHFKFPVSDYYQLLDDRLESSSWGDTTESDDSASSKICLDQALIDSGILVDSTWSSTYDGDDHIMSRSICLPSSAGEKNALVLPSISFNSSTKRRQRVDSVGSCAASKCCNSCQAQELKETNSN